MTNQKNKQKKVFVRTFGCQMNVRDSEVVLGLLKNAGYIIIDDPKKADIVLFNTCSVRQHAEDRVWSEIGTFAKLKRGDSPRKTGTVPIIGLLGCMAQEHKEKAFERMENIDLVVGPSDIEKIPAIIKKILAHREKNKSQDLFGYKIWETDGEKRPDEIYHSGFYEDKNHAYVVISEGCANYCSYCVVPYVRGEPRNRSHKDILNEVKEATKKGITKITLLGQNVNAYKDHDVDFVELLTQINAIKALDELSFFTSHPKDTSVKLFEAMRDLEKVKKHLHLPIQSGSDRILKLMNRNYNLNFYLDLVDKYRKIVTGGTLSTDIIVGFPSEAEEDFKDTFDLVKKVKFNSAYIFKYSPRVYTEAAKFADSISKEEKEKRHAAILDLQRKISKQLKK
ncbi:tRNA (N6-isopentenyl adenosine(37)-C2)-methylthiotransferase MiaB [bacterium]|nr:MAG: tRNA (N6-isopentenyl adenosine(37)-C2)-methylthiotransferase MiaB [bacterium]